MNRTQPFINIFKNSFIRGGLILSFANIVISGFNYLSNTFIAKALGPDGFGELSALLAYVSILSIPATIVTTSLIRRLGQAGKKRTDLALQIDNWFLHNYIMSYRTICFVIVISIVALLTLPGQINLTPYSVATLIIILLLTFVSHFYLALLQGLQLFVLFTFANLSYSLIRLTGSISIYSAAGGLKLLYLFLIVGTFLPPLIAFIRLRILKKTYSVRHSKKIHKNVLNIINNPTFKKTTLSLAGIAMLGNLDMIYAKKFLDATDSGLYGAWSLFSKISLYFVGPLTTLLFVFFSTKEHQAHHRKILIYGLVCVGLIGIFMYVAYNLLGETLIMIILSKKYLGIHAFLGKAAIFGTCYTIITLINSYFLAQNLDISLIIIFAMPIYLMLLFIFGHSIDGIILANIIAGVGIGTMYIGLLLKYIKTY